MCLERLAFLSVVYELAQDTGIKWMMLLGARITPTIRTRAQLYMASHKAVDFVPDSRHAIGFLALEEVGPLGMLPACGPSPAALSYPRGGRLLWLFVYNGQCDP